MGIVERKEREKMEMKSLILKTATEMFLEEGFERTSIRNIAEKIEYSPATIYLYYKDKSELFYDVHEIGFHKLYAMFQPFLQIQNPMERLHKLGETYLKFAFENQEYYNLMFIMKAPMAAIEEGDQWDCGLETYGALRETVKQCINEGLMKAMDPEIASLSVFAFFHGLVSLSIRERLSMYPSEMLPEIFHNSIKNFLQILET